MDGLKELLQTELRLRDEAFTVYKTSAGTALLLASENMDSKLKRLNNLQDYVALPKYEAEMIARNLRVDALEKWQVKNGGLETAVSRIDARTKTIEEWRSKLLGIGIVLGLASGLIGAFLMRLAIGLFGK